MKAKRYISLLLLTVYLFTVGAPAWASLSCACVASKVVKEHACCCHCSHEDDAPAAVADLSAPCCGHHHSTDVELYTAGSSDNERQVRALAVDLSPALAAEAPASLDPPTRRVRIFQRRTPHPRQASLSGVSLRAPPASV